jgi:hypothetical protein
MDILLNLPGSNKKEVSPLRVSAKSWNELKGGNFGTTAMAYAITRSYNKCWGKDSTKLSDDSGSLLSQTFNTIGMGEKSDDLLQAHNLAKYSIAADILMGYS